MNDEGVIFAYYLNEAGVWENSDLSTVESYEGIKTWVHLDFKNENTKRWLYERSGLEEHVCDALLDDDTRPRTLSMNDGILLTMRAINFNPGEDPEDMVALHAWIDNNRLITMRQKRVRAVEDVREELKSLDRPATPSEILIRILYRVTYRTDDIVSHIYEGIEEIEDQVLVAHASELRPKIASFRRMLIGIRRFIVPQKEMLLSLQGEKSGYLLDGDKMELHEIYEKLMRIVEDVNAVKDRAMVTQEELNNRIADQMNQTMYIMSIIATIFLPLGFLTGLLGINVGGVPGVDNGVAFWIVCAIIVILAIIEYILFKNKKLL
jgi:zinc transporter